MSAVCVAMPWVTVHMNTVGSDASAEAEISIIHARNYNTPLSSNIEQSECHVAVRLIE